MEGIQFSNFFFKKTESHFGHFYRDNFDIFKIYEGAGKGYWYAERISPTTNNNNKSIVGVQ